MKEVVSHQAPKVMYVLWNLYLAVVLMRWECRKKLQFSLLNAQDTVKISEYEITHRDLYTPTDRLPVKDGVLDRRLVCVCISHVCQTCLLLLIGYDGQERILRNLWAVFRKLCRPLRIHQARRSSISYRVLQAYNWDFTGHLQGGPLLSLTSVFRT